MKSLLLVVLLVALVDTATAQQQEESVRSFSKVVVSPKINLVLKEGAKESVRLEYDNVDRDRIIVEVRHKKLHIYLEDAKIFERPSRDHNDRRDWNTSMYKHASVTAYVTYRYLEGIEARGEEEVTCENTITSAKFKIKGYGENNIRLSGLETKTLKTKLYGANSLRIGEGKISHQRYALYGENKIDTRGVQGRTATTNVYGEGRIMLYATDELHLNSFGEPYFIVEGSPIISKGLVVGNARIRKY